MNTIKYNKFASLMFTVASLFTISYLISCNEVQVDVFKGKPALYFPLNEVGGREAKKGIDSAYISFSHYPGQNTKEVSYKISLIGDLLVEDSEYRVMVVDSLTTAKPDEYTIPEIIKFKKGAADDVFTFTIHCKPRLSETDTRLVVALIENENFDVGFYNQKTIKLRFDNLKIRPLWWTLEIENIYMGAYSAEKLEIFYIVSKLITIDELAPWQVRNICLDMKKYIKENNIPGMTIPIN